MTVTEKERSSALASLKNAEAQIEDQRKLLYIKKIDLAIHKQLVLDLKVELQKVKDIAKEVARVAKETTKTMERAAYEGGVEDMETRLTEKVAEVCRDYCTETWTEALYNAGVPADSELRKAESIFFPEHIRKAPVDLPPLAQALLLLSRSPVSKIPLLMLKPPQRQVRVKRSCPQPKIPNLRMLLQLRMLSHRLKQLSLSPRLGMLSLRRLTPKRTLNQ